MLLISAFYGSKNLVKPYEKNIIKAREIQEYDDSILVFFGKFIFRLKNKFELEYSTEIEYFSLVLSLYSMRAELQESNLTDSTLRFYIKLIKLAIHDYPQVEEINEIYNSNIKYLDNPNYRIKPNLLVSYHNGLRPQLLRIITGYRYAATEEKEYRYAKGIYKYKNKSVAHKLIQYYRDKSKRKLNHTIGNIHSLTNQLYDQGISKIHFFMARNFYYDWTTLKTFESYVDVVSFIDDRPSLVSLDYFVYIKSRNKPPICIGNFSWGENLFFEAVLHKIIFKALNLEFPDSISRIQLDKLEIFDSLSNINGIEYSYHVDIRYSYKFSNHLKRASKKEKTLFEKDLGIMLFLSYKNSKHQAQCYVIISSTTYQHRFKKLLAQAWTSRMENSHAKSDKITWIFWRFLCQMLFDADIRVIRNTYFNYLNKQVEYLIFV